MGAVLVGAALLIYAELSHDGQLTEADKVDVGPPNRHTEKNVDYDQPKGDNPPAGGPHDPVWQNAGFYTEPVREENVVHTLEHGAVWIAYMDGSPTEDIEQLAESKACIVASPYPRLDYPVVLTAWGYQLEAKSIGDPAAQEFIREHLQGPQTPELGAPCTGGTSASEAQAR